MGSTLCWIEPNPGTGDVDGQKRPTFAKVCRLAESLGLGAVFVVNLFAFRSTNPKALQSATFDIVGDVDDGAIRTTGRP